MRSRLRLHRRSARPGYPAPAGRTRGSATVSMRRTGETAHRASRRSMCTTRAPDSGAADILRLDTLGPERLLAQAHADRVVDGIADDRCRGAGRRLAATGRLELRTVVHQHDVDAVRNLVESQDRIARPVATGDMRVIEGYFLVQRAAHRLDDVALDLVAHAIRADDEAVVVGDDHAQDADLAGLLIDFNIHDRRHPAVVAIDPCDATAFSLAAALPAGAECGARLPPIALRGGFQHPDGARMLEILEPEFQRIVPGRRRQFVDEGLHREGGLELARRAHPRRDHADATLVVGRHLNVVERVLVPDRGAAEILLADRLADQLRSEQAGVGKRRYPHVMTPCHDVALRIERPLELLHERWFFRIPAVRIPAHPLHAHRPAGGARHDRGVRHHVFQAIAPVLTRGLDPTDFDPVDRQSQQLGQIALRLMRHLRAAPDDGVVLADVGDGAFRTDRTMGFERREIRGLDRARGSLERLVDIAVAGHGFRLAGRLAYRVPDLVRRSQAIPVRPLRQTVVRPLAMEFGTQPLRRLDGAPLGFRQHAEEVALAHDPDEAGNVLEAGFIDPQELRFDAIRAHHAAVQHAGHLHVLQKRELARRLAGNT